MDNVCDWCGARGERIGVDYVYTVMHCTKCHHEWQAIIRSPGDFKKDSKNDEDEQQTPNCSLHI